MQYFTPSQVTVLQALAAGSTVTAAAAHASISRATIYNWLANPAFKQALAFAQQEYAITIQDRMQALSAKALDKLEALLDNPKSSPSVILKACLAILNRPRAPKPGWALPAASHEQCAETIAEATAQMDADRTALEDEEEYNRQLTELYTKSPSPSASPAPRPATPRNAPCPCGSGLKFKRCCGHDAPPVLNQDAA